MPNLDLLNSALDLAVEQAQHNARICGGDAGLIAWQLIDAVEWAKRVLAAADAGYGRHDLRLVSSVDEANIDFDLPF